MKKLIVIAILLFAESVFGAEYHVSKFGADQIGCGADSGAGACLTIQYGVEQLNGGDTLIIHAGTYSEINIKSIPSGYAGIPTTIKAAVGETVNIDGGHTDNASRDRIFEVDEPNGRYITFDGLHLTGFGGHEVGAIRIGVDNLQSNIVVQNCTIYHGGSGSGQYNPSMIVFHHTINCTIKSCIIYGDGAGNNDRGGIKIWSSTSYLTVENNEIYGVDRKGVDNKHGGAEKHLVIRNNYIHDTGSNGIHLNGDHSIVENNLIVNCGLTQNNGGMIVYYEAGGPGGSNSIIRHNTFVNNHKGLILGDASTTGLTNCTVEDNLFINNYYSGHPSIALSPYLSTSYTHNHSSDYNMFFELNTQNILREFDDRLYDLQSWQNHSGQDTNTQFSKANFVGGSNPTTISGFALIQGSAGSGQASDSKDIGVDVTLVGPDAGVGTNTTPTAYAQSVSVDENSTDNTITLTGSDADGDTLTYTVTSNPANGTLSGTAPDLYYTPDADYTGSDSFSFIVNDGTIDSSAAVVTITVQSADTSGSGVNNTGGGGTNVDSGSGGCFITIIGR